MDELERKYWIAFSRVPRIGRVTARKYGDRGTYVELDGSDHMMTVGAYLPEPVPAADAVRAGRYDEGDHEYNEIESVCVADAAAPPEMAVAAATQALRHAGDPDREVAIVLHASSYYQGQDVCASASYVQGRTVGGEAPAIDIDFGRPTPDDDAAGLSSGGRSGPLSGSSFVSWDELVRQQPGAADDGADGAAPELRSGR